MTDQRDAPGYELDEQLGLDAEQMRIVLEPTRSQIIELLSERAATTSELAETLERPKGTIGHHCKVLEDAGLIRVVRTKRVRAIEARYYGRTARTFVFSDAEGVAGSTPERMLAEAAAEISKHRTARPDDAKVGISSIRYARIPEDRADEWERRLAELVTEFSRETRSGSRVFGLAVALFATTKRALPEEAGS